MHAGVGLECVLQGGTNRSPCSTHLLRFRTRNNGSVLTAAFHAKAGRVHHGEKLTQFRSDEDARFASRQRQGRAEQRGATPGSVPELVHEIVEPWAVPQGELSHRAYAYWDVGTETRSYP